MAFRKARPSCSMQSTSTRFSQRSTVLKLPDSRFRLRPSAAMCSEYSLVIDRTLAAPELRLHCRVIRSRWMVWKVNTAREPALCRCAATLKLSPRSACSAVVSASIVCSSAALVSARKRSDARPAFARCSARAMWLRLAHHVAAREVRAASSHWCLRCVRCSSAAACPVSDRCWKRMANACCSSRLCSSSRCRCCSCSSSWRCASSLEASWAFARSRTSELYPAYTCLYAPHFCSASRTR
mmetsp:Transcript_48500/g.134459  ORF Transcript_48500/g.134459 Transcript_48500/m.134459 type:complete len:240 (-) Transcript_48500:2120-2839(-)